MSSIDEVKEIKVSYKTEPGFPTVDPLSFIENGDYVDLRAACDIKMNKFDFSLIPLGVAIQLPKNYYAIVVPRSSTFKKYGIIMANSIGIIDESYCGDNDIWRFPALAMREDVYIPFNERIAQFTIVEKSKFNITKVDMLNNDDRGGFGSTGRQ